jgi:hypothetical protein
MPDITNPAQVLQLGNELPVDKKFYFNAYTVGVSPADFTIVLLNNNQPVACLNCSHNTGKSLSQMLANIINDMEKKTGQKILTVDENAAALSK